MAVEVTLMTASVGFGDRRVRDVLDADVLLALPGQCAHVLSRRRWSRRRAEASGRRNRWSVRQARPSRTPRRRPRPRPARAGGTPRERSCTPGRRRGPGPGRTAPRTGSCRCSRSWIHGGTGSGWPHPVAAAPAAAAQGRSSRAGSGSFSSSNRSAQLAPASTSSSAFLAFLSLARVSRGGSWSVFSASMPAWSSRPRSSSASNSAPKSSARFVIHSSSRKMMTPARVP